MGILVSFGLPVAKASAMAQADVPSWVKDEKMYRVLMDCLTHACTLATGGLLLAATEQVPQIIRGTQRGLLPESSVGCYMVSLLGMFGAFFIGSKRLAG